MAGISFTTAFRCRDKFQCTVENGKWKIKNLLFSTFHFQFSIMLLAVDIGNSAIKFGVYDADQLQTKFSIPTKLAPDSIEFKDAFTRGLNFPVSTAIICSVVPDAERSLAAFLQEECNVEPLFVKNDFDFGLKINYKPLSALGTDRLVNAFAAVAKYGVPCIVCSFGTATTIDAVNSNREYLGGIIAPGMAMMAESLHLNTAKLPKVEIERPESIIGSSTIASIQAGVFYGQVGLAEGIIDRISRELSSSMPVSSKIPTAIATGGYANLISGNSKVIDVTDENLQLDGLRLIFEKCS